jgi:non-heme chloroperoxidase
MNTEIEGEEHWAQKGPVSLYLWRKRLASGEKRPPVILVHGSSMSGLPSFDLQVPGHPDYSFMDYLARRGWDVWTLDHEGYGRSTITEGNSDVACGAADLAAASAVIAEKTGAQQAFAQNRPDYVTRLVLDAFVWTGKDSPTLAKRKEGIASFQASNRRKISRESIKGIFERDHPGTTHPAVAEACAEAQLALGDSVPTGTYLDMTTKLPLVSPDKIEAPTLIVRGEHDGIATMDDLLAFFRRLPTGDKRFASLPGLAHVTPLGVRRHVLWQAVDQFFEDAIDLQ